ncbi:MAG: ribonuclease HI family protein [Nitrospirae bacterium]|nr:ribonuclease HI family protein [Nitrospirota bacterium]MBI5696632.1 ribonuclease HI family protein [Nitrospirota bacterium]
MDIDTLLHEYHGLGRDGLSRLLTEAAAALGPVDVEPARPAPHKAPAKAASRKLILHTDGASRGNPGESGLGVFMEDENGQVVGKLARYLGSTTNNQAEYSALIEGLKKAIEMGAKEVEVYADSELMVKQMNGLYKVKDAGLQIRHAEARILVAKLGRVVIKYIPRAMNKEADALANEAIDKRIK